MKPIIPITFAITALLCVILFAMQRSTITQLRARIAIVGAPIANPQLEPAATSKSPLPGAEARVTKKSGSGATGEAAPAKQERVASAKKRILAIVVQMDELAQGPAAAFRAIPKMLEAIGDLSVDELIRLAGDAAFRSGKGGEFARMILVMVAAESAPMRVLKDESLMDDGREMRMAALGALARQDPSAARRWFQKTKLDDNSRRQFAAAISMNLFKSGSLEDALDFIRELKPREREAASGLASLLLDDPERQAQFVAALENETDSEVRRTLAQALVAGTAIRGTIAAARETLGRLPLAGSERDRIIESVAIEMFESDPREAMQWIYEDVTEERERSIRRGVDNWVRKDFNAAGKWIDGLEPSADKDTAVDGFARSVMTEDPEGALVWTEQIGDAERQKASRHYVLYSWGTRDRAAAEAWLNQRGLPAEEWLTAPTGVPVPAPTTVTVPAEVQVEER